MKEIKYKDVYNELYVQGLSEAEKGGIELPTHSLPVTYNRKRGVHNAPFEHNFIPPTPKPRKLKQINWHER